jgi:phosphotransferase system HPr-like phosphotransfer protein
MAEFAQMDTMDVWYAHLDEDTIMNAVRGAVAGTAAEAKAAKKAPKKVRLEAKQKEKLAKTAAKRADKLRVQARTRDSLQALSKLGELVDGRYRIVSQPPIIVPARELAATYGMSAEDVVPVIRDRFRAYRATLQDDRRQLLERFEYVDAARKVVGVGSVGTRAFIVLLQGRDPQDPLFLQIKEATESVLETYLPKSRYRQHGERVVQGQRRMQAASDIFLGWTKGVDENRHYYWRQLRDMKGSAVVEAMTPVGLVFYARTCGWTLARAHARSGDPIAITEYLGKSDEFDQAITDFSKRYADQNEQDYEMFADAVRSGRLEAHEGV